MSIPLREDERDEPVASWSNQPPWACQMQVDFELAARNV